MKDMQENETALTSPVDPIVIRQCSSCHWWFDGFNGKSSRRVCVFHTGMKTADVRKIDFGGNKPMTTTADFGCVDWMKDERNKDG